MLTQCVALRIHTCDMTRSCVWHDLFIPSCSPRYTHQSVHAHAYVWHYTFVNVTWLIQMCDMTEAHPSANPNIPTNPCIVMHMCGITHSYMWHGLFICVPWLMQTLMHTQIHPPTRACICMHAYTHPYMHTCMHTRTHTHTHTPPWRFSYDAQNICFSIQKQNAHAHNRMLWFLWKKTSTQSSRSLPSKIYKKMPQQTELMCEGKSTERNCTMQ